MISLDQAPSPQMVVPDMWIWLMFSAEAYHGNPSPKKLLDHESRFPMSDLILVYLEGNEMLDHPVAHAIGQLTRIQIAVSGWCLRMSGSIMQTESYIMGHMTDPGRPLWLEACSWVGLLEMRNADKKTNSGTKWNIFVSFCAWIFFTASPLIEEMMNYNNMQKQSTAILRHILDPTQNQHAFRIRSEAGVLIIESNWNMIGSSN